MKLSEAIKNINKSESNSTTMNIDKVSCTLDISPDIYYSEEFDEAVIGYYLKSWFCTDSNVGIIAYFFNDEFICLSKQDGRKCPEVFYFASEEEAAKLRNYILTLSGKTDKKL